MSTDIFLGSLFVPDLDKYWVEVLRFEEIYWCTSGVAPGGNLPRNRGYTCRAEIGDQFCWYLRALRSFSSTTGQLSISALVDNSDCRENLQAV